MLSEFEKVRADVRYGPDPGPVGEKPDALEEAESVHHEWWLPFASLKNIVLATWMQFIVSTFLWMVLVIIAASIYKNSSSYIPETGSARADCATLQKEFSEW